MTRASFGKKKPV